MLVSEGSGHATVFLRFYAILADILKSSFGTEWMNSAAKVRSIGFDYVEYLISSVIHEPHLI